MPALEAGLTLSLLCVRKMSVYPVLDHVGLSSASSVPDTVVRRVESAAGTGNPYMQLCSTERRKQPDK